MWKGGKRECGTRGRKGGRARATPGPRPPRVTPPPALGGRGGPLPVAVWDTA